MNIVSKLPMLIVGNWIFCYTVLKDTLFYSDNYFAFDNIDTVLTTSCLIHFFFYSKHYSKIETNFVVCVLSIILLTLAYYFIAEDIYYYLYILIITMTIIVSYVDRSRKIKQN